MALFQNWIFRLNNLQNDTEDVNVWLMYSLGFILNIQLGKYLVIFQTISLLSHRTTEVHSLFGAKLKTVSIYELRK